MKPALLREAVGEILRDARLSQGRTLREISTAACISLGYLSEIERGQKEASSEMLAAICAALGMSQSRMLIEVSYALETGEHMRRPQLVA